MREAQKHKELLLLALTLGALVAGGVARALQASEASTAFWTASTSIGIVMSAWWVIRSIREQRLGGDFIALLALVGALAIHEQLAGAVIAVMLTGGRALEALAAGHADRELRSLLARAPRVVNRRSGTAFATVPIESVYPGDILLISRGDIVPVDGAVSSGRAVLDESALTGEAFPVEHAEHEQVRSGVVNAGEPFELRAETTAEESTYAGIVRLVRQAEASRAPLVRLSDRYAFWFLILAVVLAAAAWMMSGQPSRAVDVLVVATPCPLILAVPVALVSGLSSLARIGVVAKGGAVLEQLTRCQTVLFDKTGTLTSGRPVLSEILTSADHDPDDVLRFAASLDQLSSHPLASSIVQAARTKGISLSPPRSVREVLGQGIIGIVDEHHVTLGKAGLIGLAPHEGLARSARRRAELEGAIAVFVGVDHAPVGVLIMADPIRPDAARALRTIRRQGVNRTVMITGDRSEVAEVIGAAIGLDEVLAERSPEEKVDAVRIERLRGPVLMVGDGINDAPALALADVGVAMGARGTSASSEAADMVLTVDRLDRLGDANFVARRTVRIALQSIAVGIGMSFVAMCFAAAGALPALWGALLQEGIDVAAILNALRAIAPAAMSPHLAREDADFLRQVRDEHVKVRSALEALQVAAKACDVEAAPVAVLRAKQAQQLLADDVLPHERQEQERLYPVLARLLGGTDRTSTMSRAHVEIAHRINQLGRLLGYIDPQHPDAQDIFELRRLLFELRAILELHTTQEDESYLSLGEDLDVPSVVGRSPATASSART